MGNTKGLRIVSVFLFFVMIALSGCATAPAQYSYSKKFIMNGGYEEVWSAVIDCFATYNTPIKTIEKNSGIVATDEMKIPYTSSFATIYSDYCDCGSPGFPYKHNKLQGVYNLFVKPISKEETSFQINTRYRTQLWYGQNFIDWSECESKGLLEQKMEECVVQKLIAHDIEKGTPPAANNKTRKSPEVVDWKEWLHGK